MKVAAVFGVSNTGKTTVIVNIIKELKKRNYTVGSIKDIHAEDFKIDKDGSNTHKHKEAGAEIVIARGLYETDVLIPKRLEFPKLLDYFDGFDYVVVEGCGEQPIPKIITARNVSEINERLDDNVFAVSGVIANELTEFSGLPVINACADIEALVNLIEEQF